MLLYIVHFACCFVVCRRCSAGAGRYLFICISVKPSQLHCPESIQHFWTSFWQLTYPSKFYSIVNITHCLSFLHDNNIICVASKPYFYDTVYAPIDWHSAMSMSSESVQKNLAAKMRRQINPRSGKAHKKTSCQLRKTLLPFVVLRCYTRCQWKSCVMVWMTWTGTVPVLTTGSCSLRTHALMMTLMKRILTNSNKIPLAKSQKNTKIGGLNGLTQSAFIQSNFCSGATSAGVAS